MAEKANETDCHRLQFNWRSSMADNSDSESDSKSDVSFLAVPEEFRPNSVARKSPIQKDRGTELTSIENDISETPSPTKPFSYIRPPVQIPLQKDRVSGTLGKLSLKHEKSVNKSGPSEATLSSKDKKSAEKTDQSRNHHVFEENDMPVKCRNTRKASNISGIAIKPRMPIQDWNQNRQRPRNTSVTVQEGEDIMSMKTRQKEIENNEKDEHDSLSRAGNNVIKLDVASLPPMKKREQNRRTKVKYEILPAKEQNYSALKKKRNPTKQSYRKKNPETKQMSFSIQKQEFIRWDSDLNLTSLNQNLYSSTSQFIGKKTLNSAFGDTVEWTVIREEKTIVAARNIKDEKNNDYHQIENNKMDYKTKNMLHLTEKSSNEGGKTYIEANRLERDGSKAPVSQHKNNDKKARDNQTIAYKNNLKEKKNNILMCIQATNLSDGGNSQRAENSQYNIEYDYCKNVSTPEDYELSDDDHCCLCEISKSDEINRNNNERTRDPTIPKISFEGTLQRRNFLSNNHLYAEPGKTEANESSAGSINIQKKSKRFEDSCHKDEYDCCRHVNSETNVSFQQKTGVRPVNVKSNNQNFLEEKSKNAKLDNDDVSEENKNSVLQFGIDASDLIIGCHRSLTALCVTYNEWVSLRRALIEQFEKLENTLKDSSKKYSTYGDVLKAVNAGATAASAIPHPAVSVIAKVVAILSSLISKFIDTSKSSTADVNDPEITMLLIQDIDLSDELYSYGIQCNLQFEETAKFIEESLSESKFCKFCVADDDDMTNFIRGIFEYKPTHRIFYKKLHNCFQELLQNCSSSLSRRFCEPFQLCEREAVDVIRHLDWRFTRDFNNESVRHELEEMNNLMLNNTTSLKNLVSRICNCVRILRSELNHITKCVREVPMFDSSLENKNKLNDT